MIDQQTLKQFVHYDQDTGVFTCIKNRRGSKNKVGDALGSVAKNGYVEIQICNVKLHAHRWAFLYMTGELPAGDIDHKNRTPSDNRWSNLREVTHQQNMENDIAPRRHGSLGVRGVYKRGEKFLAKIKAAGRQIHLGTFSSLQEAAAAYLAAKPVYHPTYEG